MTEYNDKASIHAAKAECRKRSRNAPLKVSELMKVGRFFDAVDRFHQWLYQSGRLAALDEIYACEIDRLLDRETRVKEFRAALELGHADSIDPTGEFFRGYSAVAHDYLQWIERSGDRSSER